MPSLFCSDECFHNNWSRHRKEVHKSKIEHHYSGSEVERYIHAIDASEDNVKDDPYLMAINVGRRYQVNGDFINAKKKYREAQKLNPKLPDAVGCLGYIYYESGQAQEACQLMEAAIERYACLCLTGECGDRKIMNVGDLL